MGKLPEYPHPAASSISSRIVVELGMLTAIMAAAAAVVGGFLASAVIAVTSFVFVTAVYVIWPITKPFLKFLYGLASGMIEIVAEKVGDLLSDGGITSKLYEIYAFGNVFSTLRVLVPIVVVFLSMALLLRFTLSRRPKNFRKWVSMYITFIE